MLVPWKKKTTILQLCSTFILTNFYIDFCFFIRTSWPGTGAKFFPKFGFNWQWRVDRWENIPIDQSSPLQTAKNTFKKCTDYSSSYPKKNPKWTTFFFIHNGLLANVNLTNWKSSFIDARGSQIVIWLSSYYVVFCSLCLLFIRFTFWPNLVIHYFMIFRWPHCLSVYLIKYQYCNKKANLHHFF